MSRIWTDMDRFWIRIKYHALKDIYLFKKKNFRSVLIPHIQPAWRCSAVLSEGQYHASLCESPEIKTIRERGKKEKKSHGEVLCVRTGSKKQKVVVGIKKNKTKHKKTKHVAPLRSRRKVNLPVFVKATRIIQALKRPPFQWLRRRLSGPLGNTISMVTLTWWHRRGGVRRQMAQTGVRLRGSD